MIVVGLDPARSFGWAVLDGRGRRIASGTWQFPKKNGFAANVELAVGRIAEVLRRGYPMGSRVVLAFEDATVMQRSAANANLYGGWFTAIQLAAAKAGVEVFAYLPGAVKETATGTRSASKDEMVERASQRWRPHVPGTDDEADALWVAETCRTKLPPQRSRSRSTRPSRRSKRASTSKRRSKR